MTEVLTGTPHFPDPAVIASAQILSRAHIVRDCGSSDSRDAPCAEIVLDIRGVWECDVEVKRGRASAHQDKRSS